MVTERDLTTPDGRILHYVDTGPASDAGLTVVWHHGTPQTGALVPPLLDAAADRGIRLLSYGRPGYGGSTPRPGRDVASAAADVAVLAEACGVDRFAVVGASGGGPHALACAALLPERVVGVATFASPAPYTGEASWFTGMWSDRALRSALAGREARARLAETDEFDPESFTAADWATLDGPWGSLGEDAQRAEQAGPDGAIDDDIAFVQPWGFDLADVRAPVLLVHGGEDRVVPPSHAALLIRGLPDVVLRRRPHDGHIAILASLPVALDRLLTAAE